MCQIQARDTDFRTQVVEHEDIVPTAPTHMPPTVLLISSLIASESKSSSPIIPSSEEDALQREQELLKPTLVVDGALSNVVVSDLLKDDPRPESEPSLFAILIVDETIAENVLQQEQGLVPEPPVVDEALPRVAPALVEHAPEPVASTSVIIGETVLEHVLQQQPAPILAVDETIPTDVTPHDASSPPVSPVAADPMPELIPELLSNPSLPTSITVGDSTSEDATTEYTPHVRRRVRRSVKRERRALRETALLSSTSMTQATFQPDPQSSARPSPLNQSVSVASTSVVRADPVHSTQHRPDDVAPVLFEVAPLIVHETIPEDALQQEPGLIPQPILAVYEAIPEDVTSTNLDDVSANAPPVAADPMLEPIPVPLSNFSPPTSSITAMSAVGESSSEDDHTHNPRPRRRVRRSVQRERRALREEAPRLAATPALQPLQPDPRSNVQLLRQSPWNRSTRPYHEPLSREDCEAGWQLVCRR
jgi:hypothetical protein